MEIPHLVVVTRPTSGAARARADVKSALGLAADENGWSVPVLLLSAQQREGVDRLLETLDAHNAFLNQNDRKERIRRLQAESWLTEAVRDRFGRFGMRRAGVLSLSPEDSPFRLLSEITDRLSQTTLNGGC
ncbi:hypothetical protein CCP2SC5_450003 [Azospirillaceae bacterium]